ncbi:MAG: RNA polymerase sigma factor, partial [Candidatus Binatia bacterium]
IDEARHDRVRVDGSLTLQLAAEEAKAAASSGELPDERLKLLFVCTHPAIDPELHTPLMLQTVLGLDAARIAQCFLVSPAAMGQRLVRAKAKIRDAGIGFEVPDSGELPARLEAVLQAIYAAYGSGWDDFAGADARRRDLTGEAGWLARVLVRLMPEEPEARGLLALMLYCESRRAARRSAGGRYVAISDQDVTLWSSAMIAEAERQLGAAAKEMKPGRFQLEAAIQSLHAQRARTGRTDWQTVALLYEGLARLAPTLGALVGRAAAMGEAKGPEAGFRLLDDIELSSVKTYQPYWAVRAHLLQRLARDREATEAYDRAIGLTEDDAIRKFLLSRRRS